MKYKSQIRKLEKFLSFSSLLFPEFVLRDNFSYVFKADKIANKKSKERYRLKGSVLLVECAANDVIAKVLGGEKLNSALENSFKTYNLLKKELRAFRKQFIICLLNKILQVEQEIYQIKKDIICGSNCNHLIVDNFSPGFCFGLTKNVNLGLFLDKKNEILNGCDILLVDLDCFNSELKALINLLIKCVK